MTIEFIINKMLLHTHRVKSLEYKKMVQFLKEVLFFEESKKIFDHSLQSVEGKSFENS